MFEIRLSNVLSSVTYFPFHSQAGAPVINIQSILCTAPDLCKNVSLAVLFGSNGNSYTVSTQSDMYVCMHVIIIIIIIYCKWVVTQWQWLFYMYTKYEIGYY